jgi:type II secretory pathway pseudopilin PulG
MERKPTRPSEDGFTLVEALTAIVVLVFGLMAITNLMLVAASSNAVANQSTAATNSASRVLDMIKSTDYTALSAGGDLDAAVDSSAPTCAAATPNSYRCRDDIPGVGRIITRWVVTGTGSLRHIRIRSEGTGPLSAGRSRAEFTTFRSCTLSACTATP